MSGAKGGVRGSAAPPRGGRRREARDVLRLSAVVRLLDHLDEPPLADALVREAVLVSGADYAALLLAPVGERGLQLRASTLPTHHAIRRALERRAGSPGSPLGRREAGPLSAEELHRLFRGSPPSGVGPGSVALIPLFADMFHALLVVGREPGAGDLGEQAVQEAIAFARAAAPHLRNVQLVGRYRDLMIRDDQTRSFNRRYFDAFLEEEFIRASRYRAPLSLIFFDLDNLKEINEHHGHAMGSEALRQTADRVLPLIRAVDKLFRYGGDEFCVVLPETPPQGAREVAERLRAALAAGTFLVEDLGGITVTASFGVAAYPAHAATKEDLVRLADEAMYRSKQAGKNAVSMTGDAPEEEAAQ